MKLSSLRKKLNRAAGHGVNSQVLVYDENQHRFVIDEVLFVAERGAIVIFVKEPYQIPSVSEVTEVPEEGVDQ